ncbi:MAG: hormogonium polysaccharide biosynthesis glycosyltransferase HpsE [Spirulinaceae cyanobacterium]
MSIDLTIAICTYNGAKRFPQVLEKLKLQKGIEGINWEILVVDNNSSDDTLKIVKNHQENWSQKCHLRYLFVPQQGLAIARQKAVEEAKGELIGFLDDDNLPHLHWVAAAYSFGRNYPQAGAYGSRIYGEFETSPPDNFQRIAAFLALTDRGSQVRLYYPEKKVLPPGAGLVVRKQAWLASVPKNCFLQGRVAGCQLPGEDLEALLHIQKADWEIWYNPKMQVDHQIPQHRLEKEQLLNLCRGVGLSRYHTRMLSFSSWQWPFVFPLYVINDLRKLIAHFFKYGKQIKSDTVTACEMELIVGSLISPFYLGKQYLKQNLVNGGFGRGNLWILR